MWPLSRILVMTAGAGRWVVAIFAGGLAFLKVSSRRRGVADGPHRVTFKGPKAQVPSGRRVYAIGDIHGRADLLRRLLEMLREDARQGEFTGPPVLVFLGDYVDRGFQSREVISILLSGALSPFETYFLKGNHEEAMLQFLTDPSIGPRWGQFGGVETLVS